MVIALGITGCIGAYKVPELIRLFQKSGGEVHTVPTRNALEFVTKTTLEVISQNPVVHELFPTHRVWDVAHIALARQADVLCVAPATANILAKFARGIADDFLSTLYLSTERPVVIAPAMNQSIWRHPATQENLTILTQRGVHVVLPGTGFLACGESGEGRLADLPLIVWATQAALTPQTLAGKVVVVNAGPTAEDIDPVRFITNRSTGRMGAAVARAAAKRGARVVLVMGPNHVPLHFPCEYIPVRTAAEMASVMSQHVPTSDIAVFSAAVADYTPRVKQLKKIKKSSESLSLDLVRTRDILAEACRQRRDGQVFVGFAAETENFEARAAEKLQKKHVDLMIGNPVGEGQGFGTETNTASLVTRAGVVGRFDDISKDTLAEEILNLTETLMNGGTAKSGV